MPHISDTQGILRENLRDAGCGDNLIRQFMALAEQGKEKAALPLLTQHRKALLDCCHAEQKKIDCLDYLIYRIEKETKTDQEQGKDRSSNDAVKFDAGVG